MQELCVLLVPVIVIAFVVNAITLYKHPDSVPVPSTNSPGIIVPSFAITSICGGSPADSNKSHLFSSRLLLAQPQSVNSIEIVEFGFPSVTISVTHNVKGGKI